MQFMAPDPPETVTFWYDGDMRLVVTLLMAAATTYVGFMWVGKYKLEARLVEVRVQARNVCVGRGLEAVTPEMMSEKLKQIARDHAVEVSDIDVSVHAIDGTHDTAAGARIQATLGGVSGLKMSGSVAEVRARMQAKQWLWRAEEPLETSCTLERKVERVLPPDFGADLQ